MSQSSDVRPPWTPSSRSTDCPPTTPTWKPSAATPTAPHTSGCTSETPESTGSRELLNAYFVARDDLYEAEAAAGPDDPSRAISQQAVIDLADELVARFVPDIAARCALTGEDPADLAYTGPTLPSPGHAISAIQPGVGRVCGSVEAVSDRGVLVQWQYTNLLPITYPRSQVVPTAWGWHIRRT